MVKRNNKAKRPTLITFVIQYDSEIFLLTCCVAGVILVHCIYRTGFGGTEGPKFLINADDRELKDAFFSNSPHLFYCHEHGNPEYVPKKLLRAYELLGSEYRLGVLNCSQVLPSGKPIFEKYKLNKKLSPVVFATAPWVGGRAKQIPQAKLVKDSLHIAQFVSSALQPRERRLNNDKDFQEFCGVEGRTCVIVVKGSLFSEIQQDTVRTIVKNFHRAAMPVVSVDSKVRWLSFESSSSMTRKFTMRLFALRNGTHFKSLALPVTADDALEFVQGAIDAPPSSFTPSRNGIKLVKPPVTAAPSSSVRAGGTMKKRSMHGHDGVEEAGKEWKESHGTEFSEHSSEIGATSNAEVRDRTRRRSDSVDEQRQKEQQRREQMDEEYRDFLYVGNEDVEEGMLGDACQNDASDCFDEEEVIELL